MSGKRIQSIGKYQGAYNRYKEQAQSLKENNPEIYIDYTVEDLAILIQFKKPRIEDNGHVCTIYTSKANLEEFKKIMHIKYLGDIPKHAYTYKIEKI